MNTGYDANEDGVGKAKTVRGREEGGARERARTSEDTPHRLLPRFLFTPRPLLLPLLVHLREIAFEVEYDGASARSVARTS